MGYTKLFNEIIFSTIWREDKHVKIVWITMLAMSNQHGEVMASIPGLADASRVTLKECEDALEILYAPDPYSRTPDNEGRRVKNIPGGWQLLNHAKYRAMLSKEERREYLKQKQQEHRDRLNVNKTSTNVNKRKQPSTLVTHTDTDTKRKRQFRDPLGKPAPAYPAIIYRGGEE